MIVYIDGWVCICVCIYMFLHAPVACIHICIYDYHWISACTVYVCLLCIHACVCSVRASEGTFGYVKVCVSGHTWKNMATINYSSEKKSPMTSKLLNIHLQSPSSCLAFQVWFRGKIHTHTHANIMQYEMTRILLANCSWDKPHIDFAHGWLVTKPWRILEVW